MDKSVQCIWVELNLPNRCPILFCAIYNPECKDTEFGKKLSAMLLNVSLG